MYHIERAFRFVDFSAPNSPQNHYRGVSNSLFAKIKVALTECVYMFIVFWLCILFLDRPLFIFFRYFVLQERILSFLWKDRKVRDSPSPLFLCLFFHRFLFLVNFMCKGEHVMTDAN